jgi:flavin reductase
MVDTSIAADFKRSMRRVAATVNVITARQNDAPVGMTATALCSLSMDPPSLLVCINQRSAIHASIGATTLFCVNILQADQLDVAKAFADPAQRETRFATGQWILDDGLPPRLAGAQANLICERVQAIAHGTHTIYLGRVIAVTCTERVGPLMYLDGSYVEAPKT